MRRNVRARKGSSGAPGGDTGIRTVHEKGAVHWFRGTTCWSAPAAGRQGGSGHPSGSGAPDEHTPIELFREIISKLDQVDIVFSIYCQVRLDILGRGTGLPAPHLSYFLRIRSAK